MAAAVPALRSNTGGLPEVGAEPGIPSDSGLVGVAFNLTGDDRPECIRAETGNIHLQTNCPIDKPASVL
jgi:hypothetical protein